MTNTITTSTSKLVLVVIVHYCSGRDSLFHCEGCNLKIIFIYCMVFFLNLEHNVLKPLQSDLVEAKILKRELLVKLSNSHGISRPTHIIDIFYHVYNTIYIFIRKRGQYIFFFLICMVL